MENFSKMDSGSETEDGALQSPFHAVCPKYCLLNRLRISQNQ